MLLTTMLPMLPLARCHPPATLVRSIELLARQPPVFYSLPMLGIALQLLPMDDTTKQRLLARGLKPDQLQAAIGTTQHIHFMAALLQPQLEAAAAAVMDASLEVSRMQQQLERLAHPVKVLKILTEDQLATIDAKAKQRLRVNVLEDRVGSGSTIVTTFTDEFVTPLHNTLLKEFNELMDSDEMWDPLASGVVEAVVEKLAAEYNLSTAASDVLSPPGPSQLSSSKPRPPKARQLLHELAPAYLWLHPKAPLSRWITRAARTPLEPLLEGLRELLLEKLQPEVVAATQKVLQKEFMDWVVHTLRLDNSARGDLQQLVKQVLQQRMNLDEWVRGFFRKAFFLNYTKPNSYMTPYRK